MKEIALPEEYTMRPVRWEDAEAVAGLMRACDLADEGESSMTVEEVIEEWRMGSFDLASDAWVVTRPEHGEEKVVGYQEVWNRAGHFNLMGDGYVHPDHRGCGIGTAQLRRAEQRAREHIPLAPAGQRVFIRNGVIGDDLAAHELHQNEGYRAVRYFWRMGIDLHDIPPAPEWPDGLSLRAYAGESDDRPVYEAVQEAFQDHWGHTPVAFEDWRQRMIAIEEFDPDLWWLVLDGDEIAGGSLSRRKNGKGWLATLFVRRPWRRQGLGLALLRQTFGTFYACGVTRVELGVDANNTTGATRLYERAGMHVAFRYAVFEKELRPGRDGED